MTNEDFWAIVAEARESGSGDLNAVEGHVKRRLESGDAAAAQAFGKAVDEKMNRAYTWPLWAAAYIIHGGCSDDAFMDFRSSLVFLGRDIFEAALANPDSLAEQEDQTLEDLCYEGLLYAAPEVYKAKTGTDMERGGAAPAEPSGAPWDEDDEEVLRALCPRLFERFW